MVYHALLPRSKTYIVLNEIEKGSSFLTTSLNSITLALIDSGYPLNYCIASCGIVLDKRDHQLYTEKDFKEKCTKNVHLFEPINLSLDNCDFIQAKFYISNKNTNLKTISLLAEGKFSLKNVLEAKDKCNDWNASFFEFVRKKTSQRFV